MGRVPSSPPPGARTSVVPYRVPFFDTDAMRVVHHANYVRYFELARVVWMDEHHRPYRDYVDAGLHFATTHVEVDYHRPAAYDDALEIETWLEWVRGASLGMAYVIRCRDEHLVSGATEHAMVDDAKGRPRRIPREWRERLSAALGDAP